MAHCKANQLDERLLKTNTMRHNLKRTLKGTPLRWVTYLTPEGGEV